MIENTYDIVIFSILRMVMKRAGYLTSLKYWQRNIDQKEEPQRTIPTRKSCRIYTTLFQKIHDDDKFWINCKYMISPQNTYIIRMPDTSINSRSSVTQHRCCDVSSCHSGIEWKWTSKFFEQFWSYVEHVPRVTQNYIPFVRDWLGMKKSSIELFFTWVSSTEDTERKMDQMIDADKLHYPYTQMTSNGAFFSGL